MKYICQCCGARFREPGECVQLTGEHFGYPAYERTSCCPFCGGSYEGGTSMVRSWRREVKNILYNYYAILRQIKELEEDLIWCRSAHRDRSYHGGISDPTAVKLLHMEKGELGRLKREAAAVKKVLEQMNSGRRDDRCRLALVDMVYLRRSHTLYGAAACLGIPERTAHRWVSRVLESIGAELGILP